MLTAGIFFTLLNTSVNQQKRFRWSHIQQKFPQCFIL